MSLLFSTGAIAGSAAKGAPGMVLLTPTSITHSGTSASIGANGQVTFTAVTSLSLNGVFSADFDNYVIACQLAQGSGDGGFNYRLRSAGTDATGANYARQRIYVTGTTIGANRSTSQTDAFFAGTSSTRSGWTLFMYGPFLAQPTASRTITIRGASGAEIDETAATHSLSTSYDGWTMFGDSSSGTLTVYGVRS